MKWLNESSEAVGDMNWVMCEGVWDELDAFAKERPDGSGNGSVQVWVQVTVNLHRLMHAAKLLKIELSSLGHGERQEIDGTVVVPP